MITVKQAKSTSLFTLLLILLPILISSPAMATETGSISGSVYCDRNRNGSLDENETGLENIHVQIFVSQCGGNAMQTLHTGAGGLFTFHPVQPSTYFIRADVACVCGGRMPTTTTCQQVEWKPGQTVMLPPFGYSEHGQ